MRTYIEPCHLSHLLGKLSRSFFAYREPRLLWPESPTTAECCGDASPSDDAEGCGDADPSNDYEQLQLKDIDSSGGSRMLRRFQRVRHGAWSGDARTTPVRAAADWLVRSSTFKIKSSEFRSFPAARSCLASPTPLFRTHVLALSSEHLRQSSAFVKTASGCILCDSQSTTLFLFETGQGHNR